MATRLPTIALFTVAVAAGIALSLWQSSDENPPEQPWQFTGLDGNTLSQANYPSEAVLINFWATWCPPCLRELPLLSELDQTTPDDKLRVLAVAYDKPENIHSFLADNPLDLDIAHGFEDVRAFMTRHGNETGSLPFSLLVDRDGKVINSHLGELLPETLPAFVNQP